MVQLRKTTDEEVVHKNVQTEGLNQSVVGMDFNPNDTQSLRLVNSSLVKNIGAFQAAINEIDKLQAKVKNLENDLANTVRTNLDLLAKLRYYENGNT